MKEFVPPYNLAFLEDGLSIARLVEDVFHSPVTAVSKIGQGFYAHVYQAHLEKPPEKVVVKCHMYAGRGQREGDQLETLRKHAIVSIPRVYSLHLYSEAFPCEALTMEFIPGVNASRVQFPDERSQDRFVDLVVETLKAWHAVHNPAGFGELGGPFHETWRACFGERIARYHERIHRDEHRTVVSEAVMRTIDRSFEAIGSILAGANNSASLVHSDYNAWNMMVDPVTYELTGAIDPLDAGWSDREIDLFHLANCRPELGMLERYLQGQDTDERFWQRTAFYRFWDDVKHYLRMGWYGEERFYGFARELEEAMDACLF